MSKYFLLAFSGLSTVLAAPAFAETGKNLEQGDFFGISFLFISMALVAATAFFFIETQRVSGKWKTSLTVSGLVTLVAATHYFYMRDVWVATRNTPTVYRYIDWLITVPLLITEFYLILRAVGKASACIFWRLIGGTALMLIFGYVGEAGYMGVWPAFILSMLAWFFVIYEIYLGEAGKMGTTQAPASVQSAYKIMRAIVVFGWSV